MAGFFSPDNWYWKPFERVGDAVLLSGMWVLTSLPVVTAGAATTALYDCVAHCVRGREKDIFDRYFRTFRRELLPSAVSFLTWALVLFGGYRAVQGIARFLPDTNAGVMAVAGMLFLLTVCVGIFAWVLPLLSRFTFTVGALNRTAIRLAVSHPFRTVLLGILTVAAVLLCLRIWVPIMIMPEVLVVCWAAIMEPVFKQYMTDEEKEAVEKPQEDRDCPL